MNGGRSCMSRGIETLLTASGLFFARASISTPPASANRTSASFVDRSTATER